MGRTNVMLSGIYYARNYARIIGGSQLMSTTQNIIHSSIKPVREMGAVFSINNIH